MMAGKLLFAMFIACGIAYAQDSAPQAGESPSGPEMRIRAAPEKKCSIPLINVRPQHTSRMPLVQPRMDFAPRRFFIAPPAPPCEDATQAPVISKAVPEKEAVPQVK